MTSQQNINWKSDVDVVRIFLSSLMRDFVPVPTASFFPFCSNTNKSSSKTTKTTFWIEKTQDIVVHQSTYDRHVQMHFAECI